MQIELTQLENIHTRIRDGEQATIARCPACADDGGDNKGEHLIVFPDGRFGCVIYPVGDEDSAEHRERILELVGIPDAPPRRYMPKCAMPSAAATVRVIKLNGRGRSEPPPQDEEDED